MAPRKATETVAKDPIKGTRVSSRIKKPSAKKLATMQSNLTPAAPTTKKVTRGKASTKKINPTAFTKSNKSNANKSAKAATKTKSAAANTNKSGAKPSTKSTTTKPASRKSIEPTPIINGTNKRKRSTEDSAEEEAEPQPAKKARATKTAAATQTTKKTAKVKAAVKKAAPKKKIAAVAAPAQEEVPRAKTRPAAPKKAESIITQPPTEKLDCYVFGENGNGELGIGHMNAPGKRVLDVKRPRLNPKLSAEDVGVVALACGGMHVVALTHDNKILTWGVNDQGALGRVTKGGEQLKTINEQGEEESDEDDDENNSGLNPLESAPAEVDYINIPEGTVFTKVAAGDSVSMILTSTGQVYGCGTFRSNEGILGFTKEVEVQRTLALVSGLKNIVDLSCGANHVIALDNKGRAYAFGSGQQNQLGRRIVERTKLNSLIPTSLNIPRTKVTAISTGSYHSFAIDQNDRVWSWGLNSFGQTGIPDDAGTDGAAIIAPTIVDSLSSQGVKLISGGSQHSVAINGKGELLAWGRADGNQVGQDVDDIPEANFFRDEKDEVNRRLLMVPTAVPDVKNAVCADVSGDTTVVVNVEGKAYSWGFSANYQTAQGTTEDIVEATMIDNTAVRDVKLVWCALGGQYGMMTAYAREKASKVNGIAH